MPLFEGYTETFNHPFNDIHDNLIVAFDFDNTIYDCHNKGGDYKSIIDLLKRCKKKFNCILVLYTVEKDADVLANKVKYCKNLGIEPDYVNESHILKNANKIYYNILLDGRAGLQFACYQLNTVLRILSKPENLKYYHDLYRPKEK